MTAGRRTMTSTSVRIADLLLSVVLLVFLCIPLLAIATTILLSMGRPILFSQQRIGRDERFFTLYKFRSMRVSDAGTLSAEDDQARLTHLGSWLRRTSLDELPQLLNVLKGEMSLVGPRPLLPQYLPYFTQRERTRFAVRPGITGIAQIATRSEPSANPGLDWDQKLELDAQYVEQYSVSQYLRTLGRTVLVLFTTRQDALQWDREAPLDEVRDAQL